MTPENQVKCRKIFEHYGIGAQRRQLIEECSELIQAICKFERAAVDYGKASFDEARKNLLSELADVSIMLEQFKLCCTGIEALDREISAKLDRQIGRIESE